MNKNMLLAAVSLVALGATAPALAADLAARPYTKAPAMVATVYDWSGFYIGINGGGGFGHTTWDPRSAVGRRRLARRNGRHGRWPDRLSLAVRPMGVRCGRPGQLGRLLAATTSARCSAPSQPHQDRCVRSDHRSDRLRLEQRPALRQGRCGCGRQQVRAPLAGGAPSPRPATAVGVARSVQASSTASLRTGRLASSTTTFSCRQGRHLRSGFTQTDHIKQDVDMGLVRLNYKFGGPMIARY